MERKGENRLDRVAAVTVGILFGVILLFLGIISIFKTNYFVSGETTGYLMDFPPLHLVSLVAVALLWWWLRPWLLKLDARWLFGGLTAAVLVVCVAMVLTTHTEPSTDQGEVLGTARQWAANNFSNSDYLKLFPNNIGLMLYFSLFSRLVGAGDITLIRLANVFWLVVAHGCLVLLADQLFKKPAVTRLTMLLVVSFYPLGLLVVFVYGNLAGLALSLGALLALSRWFTTEKLPYGLLAGILVGGAICLRNNSAIVLVAMVIFCLLDAVTARRWKSLAVAAVCLVLGLGVNQLALLVYAGLAGLASAPQGLPAIHWVLIGLGECYKGPGWWGSDFTSNQINTFIQSGYSRDAIMADSWTELDVRMHAFRQPLYTLEFFFTKAASMWNHPGFQASRLTIGLPGYEVVKPLLNGWGNLLQSIVPIASGCWLGLNFKKLKTMQLFLAVPFIGWFLFHMVWEAKALYACTYFPLLLPYAALGLNELADRLPGWWAKLRGLRTNRKGTGREHNKANQT